MRIGIVAGETSGDLLGAGLIKALRARVPNIEFEGVAGPAMLEAGCHVIESSDALAVMGLIEPIREIPRLLRLRRELLSRWTRNPPDVVIGIDSPDFNLGLELKLRREGIRTVHYVSPSVWAWRQGRIKKIRKAVDLVLCLLPFEKKFYDDRDVAAVFVGHPMAERMSENPDSQSARQALGLPGGPLVAVMPGSRKGEVERIGPAFAGACALLASDPATADVSFVAPMATPALKSMFTAQLQSAGIDLAGGRFKIIDGDSEKAITAADVSLLASGTVSLESALLQTPMVAAYIVAPLTASIARTFRLLKTPYITLPNLLTEKPLVPEFTQDDATPESLKAAVSNMLLDTALRSSIVREFSDLRGTLARGADERAADAVLGLIRS
jgi:lipid-A-disaccharide synthase